MTALSSTIEKKELDLKAHLRALGSVIVAYSGGVDSSLLAYYAREILGARASIVIAVSPSLAEDELLSARAQAQLFGWNLMEIATDEIANENYARNDERRCYFCKRALFSELERLAAGANILHIAYGANMDDRQDYRPGHRAAAEFNVVSPLQDAGLEKSEIRQLARQAGLPSWDRPQAACLASRFPTFQPVTIEGLATVGKAESYLHGLGFKQVRVRHFGNCARIEIDRQELPRLLADQALQSAVVAQLKLMGYERVEIDREGYKRGSANLFLQGSKGGGQEPADAGSHVIKQPDKSNG